MTIELIDRGDPRRRELDAIQDRIAALGAELKQIDQADFPLEEIRERTRSYVDGFMRVHSPAYRLAALRRPGPIVLLDAHATPQDKLALDIYLEGVDAYVDRLVTRVTADEHAPGLPVGERTRRVAELEREIRELCVEEETAALAIEGDDTFVVRRDGVPAELVLEAWSRTL